MDGVTEIEFAEAVERLRELTGQPVRILVGFRSALGGCVLEGRMSRVPSLTPEGSSVNIRLDGRQQMTVHREETEVLFTERDDHQLGRLEFHLPSGVVASVEPALTEALVPHL